MPGGIDVGKAAALATAVSWAFSALFFAEATRRIGAARVNLIRLSLATILLGVLVLLSGVAAPLPPVQGILLGLSGVVGLAFGDAAYFRAPEILGPRRAAIFMSLAPVFAALLMFPLLGESLGPTAIAGMAVTIGGVAWVHAEKDAAGETSGLPGRGALFGILGALGQASGYILAKAGLGLAPAGSALASVSAVPVDPLFGTLLRMAVATAWVVAVAAMRGEASRAREALADRRAMGFTLGGTLTGPVLGVWLSLVALRGNTAVASTILATSPVFVILLVRAVHGTRVSWRAWLGALAAIGGVVLLTLHG